MNDEEERPVLVATFSNAWEADLAQQYLADAGIPAWVEKAGLDNPYRLTMGGMGTIRLFAPSGRVDEALSVLDDLAPMPQEGEAESAPAAGGVPIWVRVAGGVLLAGLIISAIPHGLRVPVALVALAGWVIWRRLPPRHSAGSHDQASGERNPRP